MDNIFQEEILLFESVQRRNDFNFGCAITSYLESYSDNHYITEAEKKTLWQKMKEFFASLISSFKTFKTNLSIKIDNILKDGKIELRLRNMVKELEENKSKGATKVTTIDVIKYKNTYLKCYKNLWKYAKKFEKVDYKSVEQIDKDLEMFNTLYEQYTKELEEIGNTKVEEDIDKMIEFCKKEIDKSSEVFKTINDTSAKLIQMKNDAELLEKKRQIMGADVLPEHCGLIRRVVNSITRFVKRSVTKFITTVVFIFA